MYKFKSKGQDKHYLSIIIFLIRTYCGLTNSFDPKKEEEMTLDKRKEKNINLY